MNDTDSPFTPSFRLPSRTVGPEVAVGFQEDRGFSRRLVGTPDGGGIRPDDWDILHVLDADWDEFPDISTLLA